MLRLKIINYSSLLHDPENEAKNTLETALFEDGIVGIKDIPNYQNLCEKYVAAAQEFCQLSEEVKQKYTPDRNVGNTEGYELGAERFKNENGDWQIDRNKASYYAFVPDRKKNIWPTEVNLKDPYLALGELIFKTGKALFNFIGLNEKLGLKHDALIGYGRMLHYHQNINSSDLNVDWCGAHYDHGVFTGLMPSYYFKNGQAIAEPKESGLYIKPVNSNQFEKFDCADKTILLFQVGEFGQLISNDKIKATQHKVQKAKDGIERFSFALFYSADSNIKIKSTSVLNKDERYSANQQEDGTVSYEDWQRSSYARYRA